MKSWDCELEVANIHISLTDAGERVRQYPRCSNQSSLKGARKVSIQSNHHSFTHSAKRC